MWNFCETLAKALTPCFTMKKLTPPDNTNSKRSLGFDDNKFKRNSITEPNSKCT